MAKFKEGSKPYLFEKIAQPDENGVSRWVSKTEFTGDYEDLYFENGASWCRASSSIAKKYNVEFDKSVTSGNSVDRIRLNGFRDEDEWVGSQTIRSDIKNYHRSRRCVVLGTSNPEVDHKNGYKNDARVMNVKTQEVDDFQPLSKAANDAKRQVCKDCRKTGKRFDATTLGYPIPFYAGNEYHDGTINGCVGCYWYDPVEFRKHLEVKK